MNGENLTYMCVCHTHTHTHKMEHYLVIKEMILLLATTWIDLEDI